MKAKTVTLNIELIAQDQAGLNELYQDLEKGFERVARKIDPALQSWSIHPSRSYDIPD